MCRWRFCFDDPLAIPDYTSLCKRAANVGIQITIVQKKGKIDIVVDSTGLKAFGERRRMEGKETRLGEASDVAEAAFGGRPETLEIVAEDLTDDAAETSELLKQIPNKAGRFYGDGAYGKWKVYGTLDKRNIAPIIPPRKDAKIKRHGMSQLPPLPRDEAIRGSIRRPSSKISITANVNKSPLLNKKHRPPITAPVLPPFTLP